MEGAWNAYSRYYSSLKVSKGMRPKLSRFDFCTLFVAVKKISLVLP